jgi:AraC family transcriptional regulator
MSLNIYEILMNNLMLIKKNEGNKSDFKFRSLIEQVNQYIENNITEKITLSELANHVGISQYHFARLFKKATGISPMQFVLDKKIIKSKYLLVYTNQKIETISKELGFADQSHFSRVFHKANSVYPGKFRKDFFKD